MRGWKKLSFENRREKKGSFTIVSINLTLNPERQALYNELQFVYNPVLYMTFSPYL